MKTLLIAAEPHLCGELGARLSHRKFKLVPIADLQQGLASSELASTDILVMDLDVPDPAGRAAIKRLRELHPALQIIGLTERSDLANFAIDAHLCTLAEKPLDYKTLVTRLEAIVAHRAEATDFFYVPRRAPHPRAQPCLPAVPPRPCSGAFAGWGLNE